MNNNIFKILIFLLLPTFVFSQDLIPNYSTKNFDFVGYIDDSAVFRYIYKYHNTGNKMPIENALQWSMYSIKNNDYLDFYLFEEIDVQLGRTYYAKDDIRIYWDYNKKDILQVNKKNISYEIKFNENILKKPEFSCNNKFIFYTTNFEEFINIIETEENLKSYKLPLFGKNHLISNNYLYFDYHHIDKNKITPCPVDLYRVKIGNWNNPELLVQFISDSWLPLNDSIVLINIPIKGRGKQVIYHIANKTYVEIEKSPTKLIKYKDEEYLLATDKDNEGNKKYVLKSLPNIPTDGFIKDNQREIFPRVLQVNLSNDQKPFTNTFISEKLLYEASDEKLKELSENELRILRNSFFARYGYQFKSEDLQDFFGQFEWYNQLVESNKFFEISNEEVVISPKDKDRVELIFEIEKSK